MLRVLLSAVTLLALSLGSLAAAEDSKTEKKTDKKTENRRRPSDVVFVLIETSAFDEDAAAELQRLYDVLRKLDKNNDGKIDADELKTLRGQMIDDRVDRIFKELDANGDGKISKDEARGRIKEHFDRLDRDGDGFITREELRQAITAHAQGARKEKASDNSEGK
jgi:Ca2+-binding EF-hand superfamily protein